MRLPAVPPSFEQLNRQVTSNDRVLSLLRHVSPLVKGKYRHWDKVRRMTPPKGLSLEEWWWTIKAGRWANRQYLSLSDTRGLPFGFMLPDTAQKLLHELSQGSGGRLLLPERVLNPHTRDQYYISSLFDEAITSSQLEGATATRRVAEEMLRTGRKPRDKSEQMILNNYHAMRRIRGIKEEALTPDLVFDIHRLVTRETLDNPGQAGRLRHAHEDVAVVLNETNEVVHQPPHASELPERLQAMCEFANGAKTDGWVHPLVRAIVLHFWLAYDHPFVDGNGRTARALFYWSALHEGFWLCEFVSISSVIIKGPAKYARAFMYTETDDNDLTYFIMHHLDVLRQAVEDLHRFVQRKGEELRELEERLRGAAELNHRQRALVSHALRHPRNEYTVQSHRESHNIVYDTARRDLMDLEARGLMLKRKRGKAFVFTPAPDLEKRLAN